MKPICDNQAASKHIEVSCHSIRENIASRCVTTSFINSNDQLTDIFTKSLIGPKIKYICVKLGHMTCILQLEGSVKDLLSKFSLYFQGGQKNISLS